MNWKKMESFEYEGKKKRKEMSEELKKGIPKAITTGKKEYADEDKKKHDVDFRRILKEYGIFIKDKSN